MPTYAVVSNLFRGSTTTLVGQNITHAKGVNTNGWHTVNTHEQVLRGAFRSAVSNANNNVAPIRWSPILFN